MSFIVFFHVQNSRLQFWLSSQLDDTRLHPVSDFLPLKIVLFLFLRFHSYDEMRTQNSQKGKKRETNVWFYCGKVHLHVLSYNSFPFFACDSRIRLTRWYVPIHISIIFLNTVRIIYLPFILYSRIDLPPPQNFECMFSYKWYHKLQINYEYEDLKYNGIPIFLLHSQAWWESPFKSLVMW